VPILVRALGKCPILEMNSIAAVAILVRALGKCPILELNHARTGIGTVRR
jgi:hypothetical protein